LTGSGILFAIILTGVAIVSKVIGCGLGAGLGKATRRESLRVGIGMISRGEVGLIVASVGVQAGLVKPDLFAVVTLIVLVTTLVTPPLLRLSFADKEPSHA
jgi:Kef-type K+ transport system membrane component KefB